MGEKDYVGVRVHPGFVIAAVTVARVIAGIEIKAAPKKVGFAMLDGLPVIWMTFGVRKGILRTTAKVKFQCVLVRGNLGLKLVSADIAHGWFKVGGVMTLVIQAVTGLFPNLPVKRLAGDVLDFGFPCSSVWVKDGKLELWWAA